MVVNKITERLMALGLTEYEARTYVALLGSNPATAYETAREAAIPTSKIYQVLDRLESRNMVLGVVEEGKKRYVPARPDDFIAGQKRRMETTIEALKTDLAGAHRETEISYIWNVKDIGALLGKAERMIADSEREILLSAWCDEAAALEPALAGAAARGVRIATVLFGDCSLATGAIFHHPIKDTLYNEKGGRGLTVVTDAGTALTGTIYDNGRTEGAWSMNRGFVTLAEDYIKHDIYIMKIVVRFERELIGRFGDNYRLLRDIFTDMEEPHGNG